MPILVTDFDGTFTRRDFFDLILQRHGSPQARAAWQGYLDGELTHVEGIGGVFSALRTDEEGAEVLVGALDPAPGTADAVRRLQAAGWEVVIASAGCRWYIDRLLARLGLEVTVHASPGAFTPATGLVMAPDRSDPFHHPELGIDKPAVVRDALDRDALSRGALSPGALARDPLVACAGDSGTDRTGCLLVPPGRRFATGRLAQSLAAEGVPHVAFDEWPQIADHLLRTARHPDR